MKPFENKGSHIGNRPPAHAGGSWSTLTTVGDVKTYVVPKAKLTSGTKYWITVKAKGAATSGYSSGKSLTYKA